MKKMVNLLLMMLLSITLLTGCGNKKTDNNNAVEEKTNINVNADENINVDTYFSYDKKQLILYATNNNTYDIGSFVVDYTFYDKDNNIIEESYNIYWNFESGNDLATYIMMPYDDENYSYYVPENIEIKAYMDADYQDNIDYTQMYSDKVSSTYEVNEDVVTITLKNNAGVDLENVEATVLFMKNNKPIYAEDMSIIYGIKNGETEISDVYIPIDWDKSNSSQKQVLIEYDSIKVVINRAVNKDY